MGKCTKKGMPVWWGFSVSAILVIFCVLAVVQPCNDPDISEFIAKKNINDPTKYGFYIESEAQKILGFNVQNIETYFENDSRRSDIATFLEKYPLWLTFSLDKDDNVEKLIVEGIPVTYNKPNNTKNLIAFLDAYRMETLYGDNVVIKADHLVQYLKITNFLKENQEITGLESFKSSSAYNALKNQLETGGPSPVGDGGSPFSSPFPEGTGEHESYKSKLNEWSATHKNISAIGVENHFEKLNSAVRDAVAWGAAAVVGPCCLIWCGTTFRKCLTSKCECTSMCCCLDLLCACPGDDDFKQAICWAYHPGNCWQVVCSRGTIKNGEENTAKVENPEKDLKETNEDPNEIENPEKDLKETNEDPNV